jgi:hypothetical protein
MPYAALKFCGISPGQRVIAKTIIISANGTQNGSQNLHFSFST